MFNSNCIIFEIKCILRLFSKDFYSKFKELTSESSEMSLEQLLKHPFLSKEQVGKFKESYYQDGGKEKLE